MIVNLERVLEAQPGFNDEHFVVLEGGASMHAYFRFLRLSEISLVLVSTDASAAITQPRENFGDPKTGSARRVAP